jgi:hypothetical protein
MSHCPRAAVRALVRSWRHAVVRAAVLLAIWAPVAQAHAIHTTVTQVTVDARGVTVMIRAFADDLSAMVARAAGRPAPADYAITEGDALRYVRTRFSMATSSRAPMTLESCGIRRADDMYWLCFRVPSVRGLSGLSVHNQMLTDLHADQINIVQLDDRGRKQTMLFRKGSAPNAVTVGA